MDKFFPSPCVCSKEDRIRTIGSAEMERHRLSVITLCPPKQNFVEQFFFVQMPCLHLALVASLNHSSPAPASSIHPLISAKDKGIKSAIAQISSTFDLTGQGK